MTAARERLPRWPTAATPPASGSIIELGDAELAFELAGAQEVGAEYDLATARAALCLALGRS